MDAEAKLKEMGIILPDFNTSVFFGHKHGRMKPFYIRDKVLYLSGHVSDVNGKVVNPGRLGDTLTTEQGYEAARITGINVLAGIKQALGDLRRVKSLIRTLNFVVCATDYYDIYKVANGLTDLLADVYGPERGAGCRATLGIQALSNNACFETWVEVEIE